MDNEQTPQDKKNKRPYPELDYTITDPQIRNQIAHKIINTTPRQKMTPYYLEQLAKYITETPETKKSKTILTDNRMVTIDKRETSFQGFISKLECGEDGIYNFISEDTNALLTPKISITKEDIQQIPELKQLRQAIEMVQKQREEAVGKNKKILTKQLIEMRKDQYIIKNSFKPVTSISKMTKNFNTQRIDFSENITIDENGQPVSDGLISFFNPSHISCLLCNYADIRKNIGEGIESDLHYIIEDFNKLVKQALSQTPIYLTIIKNKIKQKSNKEIVEQIAKKYNITYSPEYISTLWRKKIPKLIAEKAKEKWIIWHYTFEEKGKWKKCSKCSEIKLAHPYFFTKNKTSKDGYYSLCKCCRNKKKGSKL